MVEPTVVPIYRSASDGSDTERRELANARAKPIAFIVKLEGRTITRVYTRASAFAYLKQYRLNQALERIQFRVGRG